MFGDSGDATLSRLAHGGEYRGLGLAVHALDARLPDDAAGLGRGKPGAVAVCAQQLEFVHVQPMVLHCGTGAGQGRPGAQEVTEQVEEQVPRMFAVRPAEPGRRRKKLRRSIEVALHHVEKRALAVRLLRARGERLRSSTADCRFPGRRPEPAT